MLTAVLSLLAPYLQKIDVTTDVSSHCVDNISPFIECFNLKLQLYHHTTCIFKSVFPSYFIVLS